MSSGADNTYAVHQYRGDGSLVATYASLAQACAASGHKRAIIQLFFTFVPASPDRNGFVWRRQGQAFAEVLRTYAQRVRAASASHGKRP